MCLSHWPVWSKLGLLLGSLLIVNGVIMAVGGVVVLSIGCQQITFPWIPLVWGIFTVLVYSATVWTGVDKYELKTIVQ